MLFRSDAASKKIFLEVALLKAIEARNAISLDSVLKQLNQLRGGQSSAGVPPASVAGNASTTAPAIRPAAKTHTAHQEAAAPVVPAEVPAVPPDLAGLWAKLVE